MLALSLMSLALAEVPLGTGGLYTTGDLRWMGTLPPSVIVDEDRTTDQGFVLDQRIRLGAGYRTARLRLDAEGDLLEGQVVGDTWSLGPGDERNRDVLGMTGPDAFSLRKASLGLTLRRLDIAAGVMVSDWGLGMLANSGARDPLFGRSDFGDRVLRLRLTTALLAEQPLYFTLAADRVIEDELGRWSDGQQIYQGIASLAYTPEEGPRGGLYGVYRDQIEADGVRRTQAGVMDVFVDAPVTLSEAGHTLRIGAEAAGITGTTDRAASYNSPEGLDVRAAGLVGRAILAGPEEQARVFLKGGWASGDGDPDDGVTNDFIFDRDLDAGMVLFDEVQGALAAASYQEITDPENAGTPPDGVDTLLTEGAIQRAAFGQLVGELRVHPWVRLRLGGVAAWQTAPISYGFETYRNGGVPSNALGEETTGRYLGSELDWSACLCGPTVGGDSLRGRPELLVQGGHYFASDNIAATGPLSLLLVSGRLRW